MLQTHTPDKRNSYLTKFKKKRVQTTDKENKSYNLSNLSTNKDEDDCCVDYKHENHLLKKMVFQLKLEMKSQLESCLIEQKQNLKCIMSQYQEFVDKLLVSKKQATQECEEWKYKFEQQQQLIEQQQQQISNQAKIIQEHIHVVDNLQNTHQQEMTQLRQDFEEIINIKDQTIDELNYIVQLNQ